MIKNIAHVIGGTVQNIFISETIPESNEMNTYIEYSEDNPAVVGGVYDAEKNIFIDIQPFPSWTLNQETLKWESPSGTKPTDGVYRWDENSTSWVKLS